jgi:hypothetical protein
VRDGLIGFVDRYLAAVAANDPAGLPVTDDVRLTENGQELPPGRGLWAIATSVPEHDYLHVEDETLGQVGWFGVIDENGTPSVTFVRLRVEDGLISEIETIVRRPQERLYDPDNMRAPRSTVFAELDRSERSSREELVRIANLYFDGLVTVDGDLIPVTDDCIRIENGTQTVRVSDVSRVAGSTSALIFPMGVREQIGSGYFGYMDDIRDRRVIAVDESRGLVMLVVVFDNSARKLTVDVKGIGEVEVAKYHQRPNSVLVAEAFKVRSGQIEHIEAVLEFVPYGARTGWAA